jgi:hypothetical protein
MIDIASRPEAARHSSVVIKADDVTGQAKCCAKGNTVGSGEIRDFFGSLDVSRRIRD